MINYKTLNGDLIHKLAFMVTYWGVVVMTFPLILLPDNLNSDNLIIRNWLMRADVIISSDQPATELQSTKNIYIHW